MSELLTGLLARALESLERHEDEEALLRLREAWREARAERIALLIERLTRLGACNPAPLRMGPPGDPPHLSPEAEGLALSEAASAGCEALEAALARREQAVERKVSLRDELLAHVGAHPKDTGARLVLADHLLEHDDPLGEFIALACQPEADEATGARLLELHRERWEELLGPGIARGWTRFKRGLPETVRMRVPPGQALPPPGPFWCAVRQLDWNLEDTEVRADWLAHPNLRNVTVLMHVPLRLAARLGTHPLPVRTLVMEGHVRREAPEVFSSLASLPRLTWLEVFDASTEDVNLFTRSALARQLEYAVFDGVPWRLVWEPAAKVPVELTLRFELPPSSFAELLHAVAGFGTRALRVHSLQPLHAETLRLLEGARSSYERLEWNLP